MKKFFIFFAATCIASAAMADAVYEPLIVESGFNRDVIAEKRPISKWSWSYYEAGQKYSYNHATQSVIYAENDSVNRNVLVEGYKLSDDEMNLLRQTGWPDDNGNLGDRNVQCQSPDHPGLYWELAPYNDINALCLKNDGKTGETNTGTLTFKNVGCFQKLYFLTFAGGLSKDSVSLTATVHYSDNTSDAETLYFYDCAKVHLRSHRIGYKANIFTGGGFFKGIDRAAKPDASKHPSVYAAASFMAIDHTKLIDHIDFTFEAENGGIAIFAVTGKTADIAAPDANPAPHSRAPMRTSNITETSFDVEWDEVSGAASYRLDVATDEDFHNMVGEYNNMTVNGTSAHVEGLNDENEHEYYWRVRSVDASGGQSASSAPRKTVLVGGTAPSTHETGEAIEAELEELINVAVPAITIIRTLYKDGDFNTLCLPFDLSAEALAASPIAGCELYEFVGAKVLGSSQLDIEMRRTNDLVAGVPYLLKWPNTSEVISELVFQNVTITKSKGDTIIGVNDEERTDLVRFIGNLDQELLGLNQKNYLFLGPANTLYWPNDGTKLKGFRAYFDIPSLLNPASSPVRQGMPARIVLQEQVTTGVENTSAKFGGCEKHLENGQLVIIRDNIRYNVMGLQLR